MFSCWAFRLIRKLNKHWALVHIFLLIFPAGVLDKKSKVQMKRHFFSDIKGYCLCVWRPGTLWWFSWRSAPCCWWPLARWGRSAYVLSTLPCPGGRRQDTGHAVLHMSYNGSCMFLSKMPTCAGPCSCLFSKIMRITSFSLSSLSTSYGVLTLDLLLHSWHSQVK